MFHLLNRQQADSEMAKAKTKRAEHSINSKRNTAETAQNESLSRQRLKDDALNTYSIVLRPPQNCSFALHTATEYN